jgi:hypothetical protein
MKVKYLFLTVFIFVSGFSFSQNKTKKYHFHSINSIGLVNGGNAVSAALQSVNGFQKGPLFAGIGVGLDYYLYRTVPVFADVRYELGKKKNKFFVYADGGINISWAQDYYIIEPWPVAGNEEPGNDFGNGIYTDAGGGYAVAMKKNNALVLSLGYSHKRLKQTYRYLDWRTNEWQTDLYRYNLNRVLLKIGWRF